MTTDGYADAVTHFGLMLMQAISSSRKEPTIAISLQRQLAPRIAAMYATHGE
jgi:hypothetical protein